MKKTSKASAPRTQHTQALTQIRAAAGVLTLETLRRVIWDEGADIDQLVDCFARTHVTAAYRSPELQKRSADALAAAVVDRLNPEARQDVQHLLDRWCSRFLLAADVGFELGFAASQNLRLR